MNPKSYIRSLFATVTMLTIAAGAWAQSRNVTGTVFDNDGKTPLVGATVLVQNTANGVISNVDGSYSIKVDSDNAVLVFQ